MKTTCPSCQAENSETNAVCEHCGYQFDLGGKASVNLAGVSRPKMMIKIILCFLIDRTGSSDQFKAGIRRMCKMTLDALASRAQSVEIAIVTYGDKDEGQHPEIVKEGLSPADAESAIGDIIFGGGGPPKENHLCGYEYAAQKVKWAASKAEGRNALVAFSTADTKPAVSGQTSKAIGENIVAKNIALFSVAEPYPFLCKLSDAANGFLFTISNDPSDEDIQTIAGKLAASVTDTVNDGCDVNQPSQK